MANLETLELTINGNAEKASQGIDTLISCLSSLASSITKPLQGLSSFNQELEKTLKIAKSIQMPDLTIKGKISNAVTNRQNRMYKPAGKSISPDEAFRLTQEASKSELLEKKYGGMMERYIPNAVAGNFDSKQLADGALQIQKIQSEIDKAKKSTSETVPLTKKIKEGLNNATEGASKFFSKVKRIATTMLIRAAIRGLIKDVKEGINNVYEWSKLNSGEFAKSFDTLKAKSQQLKNSIGAAIAPAIQAAIPIINALASAAITAFNYVNQLIALLTGQNYWTKATDNVDAYTDSVNKAGGAAKEWLASFDELNVMTSGGGGGGGGASGITSDMFENTTKFNETLKEITDFIKSNFQDIKLIAEGIGVAILSWKLANSFLETLPVLSKIAGAIGVGATIAVTIAANYKLTNQYLESGKEGWLIASALTTAIGATAAGVIAKKIFNGKVAGVTVSFALILSAITDIVANVQHTDVEAFSKEGLLTSISAALKAGAGAGVLLKALNVGGMWVLAGAAGGAVLTFIVSTGLKLITSAGNIKWGSFAATQDQINTFVQERMFDVTAVANIKQIEVANIKVSDVQQEINKTISQMQSEFNVLKLGIDKKESYNNLVKYINGDNGLIKQIEELSNANIAMLKVTYGSMQAYDSKGNAISSNSLFAGVEGWNTIKNEMTIKGQELSEYLIKGANGQLDEEMEKYTEKLLTEFTKSIQKVTNAEAFASIAYDFQTAMLDAFDKNSFKDMIDAFDSYTSSNKETIEAGWRKVAESWLALANYEDDPEKKEQYRKMAQEIIGGLEKTVAEELEKANAPGREMIMDWFFGQHQKGSIGVNWTEEYLREWLDSDGLADTLKQIFRENNFADLEINLMDKIHFSGWDFLKDDMKKKFLQNVRINEETLKELSEIDVPIDDLIKFVNWENVKNMAQSDFIKAVSNAFGGNGIALIKHRFPDIKASDIIKFSGWQDFSNAQKLEFVDAIGKAFSNEDAINAAKTAGMDLEKAVRDGMNSQNEDIRKMAEKWAEIMGIEIRGGDYKVKPTIDDNSRKPMRETIEKWIGAMGGKAKVDAEVNNDAKEKVKKAFEMVQAVMKILGLVPETQKNNVQSEFESVNPNVTVNGKVKWDDGIKSSLASKIGTLTATVAGIVVGKMSFKANGGLVNSGDLFVANENGVPEMIGRFGNQTGVANQQQIVAGISQGVYEANEKQNALLREQNALLRAIYEKDDGNGFPGANSALGRQIKRSLDAYSGLVGG